MEPLFVSSRHKRPRRRVALLYLGFADCPNANYFFLFLALVLPNAAISSFTFIFRLGKILGKVSIQPHTLVMSLKL